jgi:hypothetical protein
MSILKKRKRVIGEKFPMTRPLAQMREELKQKPLSSSPAEMIPETVSGTKIASLAEPVPTGDPGDGPVQPLPGDQEVETISEVEQCKRRMLKRMDRLGREPGEREEPMFL